MDGFLKNKKALITGVVSRKSIAYGIAEAMNREGAQCIFTYANDKLKERVCDVVKDFNPCAVLPCDVSDDLNIKNLFSEIDTIWGSLDIIVHSIAFAPEDQLQGNFVDNVDRNGFRISNEISAYSLCALAKYGKNLMKNRQGAIVSLSYLGAERSFINYNTMGIAKAALESSVRYCAQALGADDIRVNAISAGPIKTLAASGIQNFRKILNYHSKVSPMNRNVTQIEVGNVAAFLCSDLSSGITGETIHVDCGFSSVGISEEIMDCMP